MRPTPPHKHGETRDPGSLSRFRDAMDRFFENFFGGAESTRASGGGAWSPTVDVSETEQEFLVRAELPGLDPSEVDVTVQNDALVLSGEKKEQREEGSGPYRVSERRYGAFCRSIPLPASADPERIEADYDHGLLTVRVAKKEGARPRKVEVRRRDRQENTP
ncbi:MAG TPA: Hsp20/alpha crystallin family protein [Planctomycetota bacterium]|nr:Hsp20/alpha crystallin family protein [Planctomycetota bacterium]